MRPKTEAERQARFKQYADDGDWHVHPLSLVGAEVAKRPSAEWQAMEEFHRQYNES